MILEPSAGDGRILDYLQNGYQQVPKARLFACEIQPDLVVMLQGKGYSVLERDFMDFQEPMKFELILANPPFSTGVRHLLKMWEILEDGGELVCLLNWQNIRFLTEQTGQTINSYQQLLGGIIGQHGTAESIGQAFKYAERPTDVEVGLVYLKKPEASSGFAGFNVTMDSTESDRQFSANPLAHGDMIKSLVSQYEQARRMLVERNTAQSQLDFYLQGVPRPLPGSVTTEEELSLTRRVSLNTQIQVLKSRFWQFIFQKTDVGKKATSDFREKFEKFALANSCMAFTEHNIREVLGEFMSNMKGYMQDAVIRVFDKATAYHENNKIHHEGWKTNKGWKVNRRIIVPNGVNFDDRWGSWRANYYNQGFLDDLDRVLCWISGTDVNDPGFFQAYRSLDDFCDHHKREGKHYSDKFYSTFFEMRMYKKGTLHIDFLDQDLLAEFNRVAAEGKNWIGGKGY